MKKYWKMPKTIGFIESETAPSPDAVLISPSGIIGIAKTPNHPDREAAGDIVFDEQMMIQNAMTKWRAFEGARAKFHDALEAIGVDPEAIDDFRKIGSEIRRVGTAWGVSEYELKRPMV